MNQILYTETSNKSKGPIEIKKIILFFSIAIILFGIILLGQWGYGKYKKERENKINNTVPSINIEQIESEAIIKVTHDKVIRELVYTLNNGQEKVISGNGNTNMEQKVELNTGNNLLLVKVIDINGKEEFKQYNFEVESLLKIELAVVGNKIKITAFDTKEGMAYLTYSWNNDTETRVDVKAENPNKIEVEADIPVGLNTLKINAVNKNNVVRTKEQEVKGVKKPEITAYHDGEYINITVKDEEGIKTIEHNINGEVQNLSGVEGLKEVTYKQQMLEGDNNIIVTVTSISGAKEELKGVCKK